MFVIGMTILLITLAIAFLGTFFYKMQTGIDINNVANVVRVGNQYDPPGTKYMLDSHGNLVRAGYTISEGETTLVLDAEGNMTRVYPSDTASGEHRAALLESAGITEQTTLDPVRNVERTELIDAEGNRLRSGAAVNFNGKNYTLDSRGNFVHSVPPVTLGADEKNAVLAKVGVREHNAMLGLDDLGRDYVALLILGLRSSLWVGLLAGIIATLLGTLIGIYGGFKGGVVDDMLSVLTNLFIVIPQFVILVLISSSISQGGRSLTLIAVIIGLTSWTWSARSVRAQSAALKSKDHISLARLNGDKTLRVLFVHILPYLFSYVFMVFIMTVASGILSESAISMIGLGPNDTVSLGVILNHAQNRGALGNGIWWAFLPATVIIMLVVFALYLINTSMEGVFNPRLRK